MTMDDTRETGLHPGWWTAILVSAICMFVYVCSALFSGTFRSFVPVTLTADRSGLVMESGAKVKMRGVVVGRVAQIHSGGIDVVLKLELLPGAVRNIPANVDARIEATTAFGAKYVNLIPPPHPSVRHIAEGAVLRSDNLSTEVNTVFENLTTVLAQVEPAKLNATLTALADGLRGQGPRIGDAISGANQVLVALNARTDNITHDFRSLKGFGDAYGAAAPDLLRALDALSVTSTTITGHAGQLDTLLLNVIGLSRSGVELLGPNRQNLITSVNNLAPTTDLLMTYNPILTCMLVGADWFLQNGGLASGGGNGKSAIVDAAILFADDVYRYPEHLPKTNARGGPGGKPQCGSLPIADNNFPVKQLVTDTGWGTHPNDIRTKPGWGHPFYVNYLPSTRGVPGPPRYGGANPPNPWQSLPPPPSGLWPALLPPPPPSAPDPAVPQAAPPPVIGSPTP
jgi:phospholipid/cholesterol/gamma-HCH transport system substrate-binding protein